MNRITLTAFLLSFFCFNNLQAEPKSAINFQKITFSEVKNQAFKQQKHILTYIQGNWCLGCRVMKETTFTDQKLVEYVNNEFLAVKVDIHSALGKEWDDEFQITCLPTFLIFDKNGQLLDRYETTFTGSALHQVLRQSVESGFVAQNQKTNPVSPHIEKAAFGNNNSSLSPSNELPDSNKQKVINQHIEQLELLLQKNEDLVEQATAAEQSDISCQNLFSNIEEIRTLIDALKDESTMQPSEPAPTKELVVAASVPLERQTSTEQVESTSSSSSIKKLYAKGSHKVQLGEYSDYNEAAKVIKRIESKFAAKDVFLLIDKKGHYSTYRILVKGFENQKEASDFIGALREMGFNFSI